MKLKLLTVIACTGAPSPPPIYGLECYSAAGSVTLAANGSFASYRG